MEVFVGKKERRDLCNYIAILNNNNNQMKIPLALILKDPSLNSMSNLLLACPYLTFVIKFYI